MPATRRSQEEAISLKHTLISLWREGRGFRARALSGDIPDLHKTQVPGLGSPTGGSRIDFFKGQRHSGTSLIHAVNSQYLDTFLAAENLLLQQLKMFILGPSKHPFTILFLWNYFKVVGDNPEWCKIKKTAPRAQRSTICDRASATTRFRLYRSFRDEVAPVSAQGSTPLKMQLYPSHPQHLWWFILKRHDAPPLCLLQRAVL